MRGTIDSVLLGFCLCCASILQWNCAALTSFSDENPVVETHLGRIRGSVLQSRLGERFYAFRGIRYAQPPIGKMRFKVSIVIVFQFPNVLGLRE